MRNYRFCWIVLILALGVAACGGPSAETASQTAAPQTAAPQSTAPPAVVATVTAESPAATPAAREEETPMTDEQAASSAAPTDGGNVTRSEAPLSGTVNLSDLATAEAAATAEPADTTPRVMPAPGRPFPPELLPLVEQMLDDAAERAGASRDLFRVMQAEPVTWPDSSLGCPQPGMQYMQVLVDGYRVTLSGDGREYVYHTAGVERFVYCEDPAPAAPAGDS